MSNKLPMIGSWRGPGGKFQALDPRFTTIKYRSVQMDRKITASQNMVATLSQLILKKINSSIKFPDNKDVPGGWGEGLLASCVFTCIAQLILTALPYLVDAF